MLQNKIINKALSTEPPVSTDRSRCVRMRFNKNTCTVCTASCRAGAISIDNGIAVNAAKCTECMLCVSECPSGCFTAADEDFAVLLSKLRKTQNSVPHPVLGCSQARDAEAHAKTCCLGFLSEEHLIAIMGHLDKPLYLNLIACSGCRNAFVVETLKGRIHGMRAKTGPDITKKIVLAENKNSLAFEEVSLDRRGFFQALRNATFSKVAGLIDDDDAEPPVSYTAKRLPLKRDILNTAVKRLASGNTVSDLLHNYYFTVTAGPTCNTCFACIGMCPTGALKIKKDAEGQALLFNSSMCTGCGLCRDFCPAEAVSVSPGFFGNNFFDHNVCNDSLAAASNN